MTGNLRLSFLWKCRLVRNQAVIYFSPASQHSCTVHWQSVSALAVLLSFTQTKAPRKNKNKLFTHRSVFTVNCNINNVQSTTGFCICSSHKGLLHWRWDLCFNLRIQVGKAPWAKAWLPGRYGAPGLAQRQGAPFHNFFHFTYYSSGLLSRGLIAASVNITAGAACLVFNGVWMSEESSIPGSMLPLTGLNRNGKKGGISCNFNRDELQTLFIIKDNEK